MNREALYTALFSKLMTAGTAFATYTRVWLPTWDDAAETMPALPMLYMGDRLEQNFYANRGIGDVRTMIVSVEVYAKIPRDESQSAPDRTTPGATVLNPLIDAIETALLPGVGEELQTLGGLCYDCRIEQTSIKMLGDMDPNGEVSMGLQVHIVVPQ